jgi:hypothetical protein
VSNTYVPVVINEIKVGDILSGVSGVSGLCRVVFIKDDIVTVEDFDLDLHSARIDIGIKKLVIGV